MKFTIASLLVGTAFTLHDSVVRDDEIAEGLDLTGGVVAAGSRERARG